MLYYDWWYYFVAKEIVCQMNITIRWKKIKATKTSGWQLQQDVYWKTILESLQEADRKIDNPNIIITMG